MVEISQEAVALLEAKQGGVFEIAGMPESGTTTAAEILLAEHIARNAQNTVVDAICFAQQNAPNAEYIKNIVPEKAAARIVHGFYNRNDTNSLLLLVESLADACDVIVIDDFYNVLMYRRFNFIRNFMKSLKNIAAAHNAKILFVNQYRHVINNDTYCFATEEAYKTMYFEHLDQYVDGRLGVTKDDDNNIYMELKETKIRGQKSSLENILDSFI